MNTVRVGSVRTQGQRSGAVTTILVGAPLAMLGYAVFELGRGRFGLGAVVCVTAFVLSISNVLLRSTARPAARPPFVPEEIIKFTIPHGSMLAIVGRAGSGKSRLASRLLRGPHAIRRGRIGVAAECTTILGSSIRANIAVADPTLSLDRVIDSSKIAGLHEDIMTMPMGYETPLGPGGGTISSAQRQRIALARAVVTRPGLVFLDEATSALDEADEAKVYANLARMGCTRLVVTQRPRAISRADLILVLEDGKLIARGTHPELMVSSPAYRELVAMQDEPPAISEVRSVVNRPTVPSFPEPGSRGAEPVETQLAPRALFSSPLPRPHFGRTRSPAMTAAGYSGTIDIPIESEYPESATALRPAAPSESRRRDSGRIDATRRRA